MRNIIEPVYSAFYTVGPKLGYIRVRVGEVKKLGDKLGGGVGFCLPTYTNPSP